MVAKIGGNGAPIIVPRERNDASPDVTPQGQQPNPGWVPGNGARRTTGTQEALAPARVQDGESFSSRGLSADQLRRVMPHLSAEKAEAMLPHLNRAMREFNIDTPQRASAFLAQLAHESGELRYFEEIASGSAYEGRRDLGNTQPGDGRRFKGRGPIQLTGRANYEAAGRELGLDLVNNPELAARPDVGFRIAGWYWNSRNLNSLADRGNFQEITRRVNGGFNGAADRNQYYARAQSALGGGMGGGPLATGDTPVPTVERSSRYEMAQGSRYDGGDSGAARMVRSYSERPGRRQYDPSSLYTAMLLAMARGWRAEDLADNAEFQEFAKAAGWQPGTPIPDGLAQEFLAHQLTTMAENDPGGLMGAVDKLKPQGSTPAAPSAQ